MGTKLTPVIGLDNRKTIDDVINIVTSSGVYFTDQISKKRFWSVNYTPDYVTMLMTSSIVFYCKDLLLV